MASIADQQHDRLANLVLNAEQTLKSLSELHGDSNEIDYSVLKKESAAAEEALIQIQCFLAAHSLTEQADSTASAHVNRECQEKLLRLCIQQESLAGRGDEIGKLLTRASCPENFKITTTNPTAPTLISSLKERPLLKDLLSQPRPSCRVVIPSATKSPLGASDAFNRGEQQQQTHNEKHTVNSAATAASVPAPLQPQPATTVNAQQPQQQDQHQQQQQKRPVFVPPAATHPPPPPITDQNNNTSDPPHSAARGNGDDSRWASKVPRGPFDTNIPSGFRGRRHKDNNRNNKNRQRGRNNNGAIISDDDDGDTTDNTDNSPLNNDDSPHGNPFRGFKTARTQLISDHLKKGNTAAAKALQGLPRQVGLRRPTGNGNGSFIPPFIKKGLQAQGQGNAAGGGGQNNSDEVEGPFSVRTMELLKLNPGDPLPEELSRLDPHLIEAICNEVIDSGGRITWEDIAGQEGAKKLIQEVVVWPMLNPHIFQGARAPPSGVLCFGPPGTGKTMIGKAIASNINATFFSISASSLTSKWIGEGEKMVRTLFSVARWVAPAVIFVDEIDSLLSARKAEGEHEASRRLKTEMLVQMEGCAPGPTEKRVLLIGATNRPEELDEAARRRMPKQLYIPLPDATARRSMVERQLGPGALIAADLSSSDYDKIVLKTQGYSGSDMKNLIQEACQGPVRDAVRAMGAGVAALQEQDLRPVVLRDFQVAAKAQKASVEPAEVLRYEAYNEKHGAKLVDDDTHRAGGGGGDGAADDEEDW